MPTLILSSRNTPDHQHLWRAAIQRGWTVERAIGPKLPPLAGTGPFALYSELIFARELAQRLQLEVILPPADWLARLPRNYAQRWIRFSTMQEARQAHRPQFVKPPNDKSFPALVYATGMDLPSEIPEDAEVLIIEPVKWTIEFRAFIRHRQLVSMSPYLEEDHLLDRCGFVTTPQHNKDAETFLQELLSESTIDLPTAVVIDVGLIEGRGWAVIELNPACSSGLYGCDPDAVLDVLLEAIKPMATESINPTGG